jgi:hypothetical protein
MTTTASPLTRTWQALLRVARQTGKLQRADLKNKARMGCKVADGLVVASFARPGVPLGDVELNTFRAYCGVPAEAERWPAEGQASREDEDGTVWRYVLYRWEDAL